MTPILLGIVASIATEIVTWINAKLNNTVLKGDGAFLLASGIAFLVAGVKFFYGGGTLGTFFTDFSTIWASSQAFFLIVMQTLGLDVQSPPPAALAAPSQAQSQAK